MQRYAFVIGLHPEQIAEYKRVHAAVWPDVLKQIKGTDLIDAVRRVKLLVSASWKATVSASIK